jgi:hypothetical protein
LIASIIDINTRIEKSDEYVESISHRVYKCANTIEDGLHLEYKQSEGYLFMPLKDVVKELMNVHNFTARKRDTQCEIVEKKI